MTTNNLLIAFGVGSAFIAFWFAARFPDRGPGDFNRALLHALVAFVISWAVPSFTSPLMAQGLSTAMLALFVVVLPVLFYTFLSCAWVLKLLHERISHYQR
jgi:antibiotic biosynthesis monooxygenase (ABM) superfamily enzyme